MSYKYLIRNIELENNITYISIKIYDNNCYYTKDVKLSDIKSCNVESLEKYYEIIENCINNESNIKIIFNEYNDSLDLIIFDDTFELTRIELSEIESLRYEMRLLRKQVMKMSNEINLLKMRFE
jgi:hypothetical protein